MANNYSQWSTELEINSEEEYSWLQEVFSLDPYGMADEDDGLDRDKVISETENKLGFSLIYDDFDEPFPHFDSSLSQNSLWVYAEEYGNIEILGRIVQSFFRKFRPDGFFSLTWADTCSKMRVDEFGGGAMIVTAEKIEVFTVYDFVREKQKLHDKSRT